MGEKSGIYHFSMEGWHYKLAGHAEPTTLHSLTHSVRVFVFCSVLLSVMMCWLNAVSACVCEHVRRWILLLELHRFQKHQPLLSSFSGSIRLLSGSERSIANPEMLPKLT